MDAERRFGVIGLRVLALLGALVAFTLIINLPWFDEELRPELARFVPPEPIVLEGNAFPYFYGFAAANDRDPGAAGADYIGKLRELYLSGKRVTLSGDDIDEILGNPPEEDWARIDRDSSCYWQEELDCAERMISNLAGEEISDERLSILLSRFETMLTLGRYEENKESGPYTAFPSYGPIMTVSRIRLAIDFENEPTEALLDRIGSDVRFWKMMLRDSDTLISKMIALGSLRNNMQFLPALMRARDLSPAELARIVEVLSPLSEEERDIGEAFLGEMRYVMHGVLSIDDDATGLQWPWALVIQKNATMNAYYENFTVPMQQRAALSASELYALPEQPSERYSTPLFPPPLYNLGGKLLVLSGIPTVSAMTDYINRAHDVEGRIALILLQAEILANPDEPIERVVRRSEYRNPYTLEPMDYDADSGLLSFECVGIQREVCAVDIRRD